MLHVPAKIGRSELSKELYSITNETTKTNVVPLNKGKLVIIIPLASRHPIKIIFPGYIFLR